jgi:VanZ family protein
VYGLLLLHSGLAPWSGWRDLGIDPWSYLYAPAPRYITTFDVVVNVLAYVPFGALIVLALHPRVRGIPAALLGAICGVVLSGSIEAAQSYLPTRVSSNIDLLTNSLGALAGAVIAAPLTATLIDRGRLAAWRQRWFERGATAVLVAVAAWPAAQIYPTPMLFGNGDLRLALTSIVEALGGHWWQFDAGHFGPAEFVLAEAFIVAAAVLASGLALSSVMRAGAPRYRLLAALLCAALTVRTLANAVQFGPDRWLAWLTPGAAGGLALGLLSLSAASGGRRVWQARIALITVLALIAAVNVVPENPYHLAQMQEWRQGRLLNFNALTNWVAMLWPPALAVGLLSLSAARS